MIIVMLMIRLSRIGKKHSPDFRIVAVDSRRSAKSGSSLEVLGSYNPKQGKPQLKAERIKEWISKGAQVSSTVRNLLINEKIIEGKKKDVLHHAKIKAKLEKNKVDKK